MIVERVQAVRGVQAAKGVQAARGVQVVRSASNESGAGGEGVRVQAVRDAGSERCRRREECRQ
jgi:hypothetical protein